MKKGNKTTISGTGQLKPETLQFYNGIVKGYVLESHHLRILQLACQAWDRAAEAQAALDLHGLTYEKDGCPRPRPEVRIKEQAEICFARMIRELNLDIEAPRSGPGRPPSLY